MIDLTDRVILVTGAAGGIGAATARTLVADGAAVIVHDLRRDGRLKALADELGDSAHALQADLGDPAAAAMVVRQAVGSFLASEKAGFVTGQVIYNVGGQHGPIRRLAA